MARSLTVEKSEVLEMGKQMIQGFFRGLKFWGLGDGHWWNGRNVKGDIQWVQMVAFAEFDYSTVEEVDLGHAEFEVQKMSSMNLNIVQVLSSEEGSR